MLVAFYVVLGVCGNMECILTKQALCSSLVRTMNLNPGCSTLAAHASAPIFLPKTVSLLLAMTSLTNGGNSQKGQE